MRSDFSLNSAPGVLLKNQTIITISSSNRKLSSFQLPKPRLSILNKSRGHIYVFLTKERGVLLQYCTVLCVCMHVCMYVCIVIT